MISLDRDACRAVASHATTRCRAFRAWGRRLLYDHEWCYTLGPIGSAMLGPNETASSGEHNGFGDAFEVWREPRPTNRSSSLPVSTTQKGELPTPLLDGASKPFYMTGSLEIFGKHG